MLYLYMLLFAVLHGSSNVNSESLNTNKFPDGFLFGTASSAYQTEGAWNESGKGENIWDRLVHNNGEHIVDGSTADVACDSYTHAVDDVALIKDLGVDFYRFSLSWSRLLPTGFIYKPNSDGVRYYNELLDALAEANITAMVTLYHWDLPQPLQDMGGFMNGALVDYFEDYARFAFENFGNRVKYWSTFNEPMAICHDGYGIAHFAPLLNVTGIGEYLCGYNLLRAHARAYHTYDEEFRAIQAGNISINLNTMWFEPATESAENVIAAERVTEFYLGWFANPIFGTGDYPNVMKESVSSRSRLEGFPESRLPELTEDEIEYIKGTSDYFGLNYYTSRLVENNYVDIGTPHRDNDWNATIYSSDDWSTSPTSDFLKVTPWGLRKTLNWIRNQYGATIFVTENGYGDEENLEDADRIVYYQLHLSQLLDAVYEDGVDVKAFTFWSLLDNFEWTEGYKSRFGLYHVDFEDEKRTRTAKLSTNEIKTIVADRVLPATTYGSSGFKANTPFIQVFTFAFCVVFYRIQT